MSKLSDATGAVAAYEHIHQVRSNIYAFVQDLLQRAHNHDQSKLESPELEIFGENTPKLAQVEYDSPEYKALLEEVRPAIDHHYANNRHHPEHWPDGINDMTLVDLMEMLADWQAATLRNKNGNIRKSIEANAKRYKMTPQLRQIFENTVREMSDE